MNFSTILSLAKKHIPVVVSLFVILGCSAYSLLNLGELSVLEAQERDLSIEYGRVMKNLKYGQGLTEDLDTLNLLEADAESRLFVVKDLAKNYDYFYTLESETGVAINAMRQLNPKPVNVRSKKDRSRRKAKYSNIGYDVSVTGSFEQVVNFLRSLEGGPAHYNMANMLVRQVESESGVDSDQIQVSLGVSVLAQKI